jgi:hypothetical protein
MRGRGRLRDLPATPARPPRRAQSAVLSSSGKPAPLTLGQGVLRILRALLPVVTLYIGN